MIDDFEARFFFAQIVHGGKIRKKIKIQFGIFLEETKCLSHLFAGNHDC